MAIFGFKLVVHAYHGVDAKHKQEVIIFLKVPKRVLESFMSTQLISLSISFGIRLLEIAIYGKF